MKFAAFIFAAATAASTAAAPFGDSDVGYFITPPTWATTGGVPAHVAARYTPAGATADVVRLNVPAALGMCATLDACAERWWVPIFSYPSPGHRAHYEYTDFYAGPPADWARFDFSRAPFDVLPPLWAAPADRVISNSFGRIFFTVSDRLEDVRSRLRSFASVHTTSYKFGNNINGSSLFGGIDTVDFDWCERPDALAYMRAAFDEGLCLDWSCLSNSMWSGEFTDRPHTVLLDVISLDMFEYTNVIARARHDAQPPLPDIYDILTRDAAAPPLSRGWLSYSNITSRISADDFGWMNRLLASLDKTYLVDYSAGLPIIIREQIDIHGEAQQSQALTNGYFHLSVGPFDTLIASLHGASFGDKTTPSPVISTNETTTMGVSFAVPSMSAAAALNASGYLPLAISASFLDGQLPSSLGNNESVRLIFFVDPGESENIGPVIDFIAETGNSSSILLHYIRVLDEINTVPVVGGSLQVSAEVDLSATGRNLPFASLGSPLSDTNSIPHVRPLPDSVASGFVAQVALQLAARRNWSIDASSLEEYAAVSDRGPSRQLDDRALQLTQYVKMQCEADASSMFDVDFSDIGSSGSVVVRRWLASANALGDAVVQAATNGTWGVSTVDEAGDVYLANTNGAIRLFLDTASGWSELPRDSNGYYIYGGVSADCVNSAGTNAPSRSLEAEFNFGAAVYWHWPALPANSLTE